jgi:hypothetical protein
LETCYVANGSSHLDTAANCGKSKVYSKESDIIEWEWKIIAQ